MFCTKHAIRKISNMNEQCLPLIQDNYAYDCGIPLEDANLKSVYQKCIKLMAEVYKYLHGLSPDIVSTIFKPGQ